MLHLLFECFSMKYMGFGILDPNCLEEQEPLLQDLLLFVKKVDKSLCAVSIYRDKFYQLLKMNSKFKTSFFPAIFAINGILNVYYACSNTFRLFIFFVFGSCREILQR